MNRETSLRDAVFPYLEPYSFVISATGIRYGSVAYIAFGQSELKQHRNRASTKQYPVELEIGSDNWSLIRDGERLIDSRFIDANEAREKLEQLLVGQTVIDICLLEGESRIAFSDGITLCSQVGTDPASGFLYSFQVEKGPTWETIDGASLLG